jgi:tape measure domain-containing protein
MSGVDNRIVSMQFDNAAFEQKMAETLKNLDKLNQSLSGLSGSKHGLDELSNAGKNFDMGDMGGKVEGVSAKFLALTTIAVTALATITAKAVSAGAHMLSSFSFAPIMDGFREFETNMGSIQTIMSNTASKGTTLKDVNAALDQLNTYSDKTIYNFGEMARNIGTFTAAGVNLDTSVKSIKGIANLAAMSGSSSEQASTAMYQLSQAIASGTVKLMDWNSVVNAGMGGEVFQKALFESGKAMKTLKDVPMGETFEDWKKKGNSFRESLQDGWITSEVLTKTLSAFTGDLSEQQIIEMGYTKQQAEEFLKLGKNGMSAAQDIKTFSQLMSTVKESIGSGWSQTFRTLIGDFEEGKKLWTGLGNAIGGFIGQSADARNKLLSDWKNLGGRDSLLQGLENAFHALANVFVPIKNAFREIFPPMTADRLLELTKGFENFTNRLAELTERYMPKVQAIFKGVFAAIEIGVEIIKGVLRVIGTLISSVTGAAGGGVIDFFVKIAGFLVDLNNKLVAGGGIEKFFDGLTEAIKKPIAFLQDLTRNIVDFFKALLGSDEASQAVKRVGDRLDAVSAAGDRFSSLYDKIVGVLDKVWGYISTWFKELGHKLAAEMTPGDFDAAVDVVNVGLLGGLILMFKKFIKNGLNVDFGGGIIDKIKEALDGVTGTLSAMQTQLKAKALMEIAIALGVLTASIVVLSMIDSAKLTKALTAITVGFAQLIGAMTLLDKLIGSTGSAAKLGVVAAGMTLMATAVLILSAAIKNLSSLDWGELAKGLVGAGVGLGILTAAANLISANTSGMVRAGVAMIAMSTGLLILSEAVKSFADLSWGEMAKGLIGVSVGLGVVAVAANLMPTNMIATGPGLIALATGLVILSQAVNLFSNMSWGDMAKGLVGVAGGLAIIAVTMNAMPITLPITAAGLILVATALTIMAGAVAAMGSMKLDTLAKGVGSLAAVMLILAAGLNAMNGTLGGSAALLVAAGALTVLTAVIKVLGDMPISQIITGIAAIAGAMIVLGAAGLLLEPVTPALMGLAVALGIIGASFALFGVGVMLVAKAFETLAKSGAAGAKAIVEIIKVFLLARFEIARALVLAFIGFAQELLNAAPLIIKSVKVLLGHILDTIIEVAPKIAETLVVLLTNGLEVIRTMAPQFIETGFQIFTNLLQGFRDHLPEIMELGVEIIENFTTSLANNAQRITDAAVNMITAFVTAIGSRAADIVGAGLQLLVSFLLGITQNIAKVTEAVASIIIAFLAEIANSILRIVDAGTSILIALMKGISDNIQKVVDTATDIVIEFMKTLAANYQKILDTGFEILTKLLKGIYDHLVDVTNMAGDVITKFVTALGDNATKIVNAGADALLKFLSGIDNNITKVGDKATDVAIKFINAIGENSLKVINAGAQMIIDFLNGLADTIEQKSPEFREAGQRVAFAIADGISGGFLSKAKGLADSAINMARSALDAVKGFLGIFSPSRKFHEVGEFMAEGMANALKEDDMAENSAVQMAERIVSSFHATISKIPDSLNGLGEFNPVITPVLDLTKVQAGARSIDQMMAISTITPEVSIGRARTIATTTELESSGSDTPAYTGPAEVNFVQNNYSPEALSTNDIYRNTKSQIALAKEELGI